MSRLLVGVLLVVMAAFLLFASGCGSHMVKGEGSMLEYHSSWIIGNAPLSHKIGVNPLLKDRVGPADEVASGPITGSQPTPQPQTPSAPVPFSAGVKSRPARD